MQKKELKMYHVNLYKVEKMVEMDIEANEGIQARNMALEMEERGIINEGDFKKEDTESLVLSYVVDKKIKKS
jgi:hypothetical protein